MVISIHRGLISVVTFTVDLTCKLEVINRLAIEALNKQIAARIGGNYDEEQMWAQRYAQYLTAHEKLRKLIRSLESVPKSIAATIQAMKLKQLQLTRRQPPNAQFVDGLVASVPVPPTSSMFAMESECYSNHRVMEAIRYVFTRENPQQRRHSDCRNDHEM